MDQINHKLELLLERTAKIDDLYSLLTSTNIRVDEVEKSQTFLNQCFEQQKKEIETLKNKRQEQRY